MEFHESTDPSDDVLETLFMRHRIDKKQDKESMGRARREGIRLNKGDGFVDTRFSQVPYSSSSCRILYCAFTQIIINSKRKHRAHQNLDFNSADLARYSHLRNAEAIKSRGRTRRPSESSCMLPASESKHVKSLKVNLSGREVYLEQDDASENTTGSTLWLSGQVVCSS